MAIDQSTLDKGNAEDAANTASMTAANNVAATGVADLSTTHLSTDSSANVGNQPVDKSIAGMSGASSGSLNYNVNPATVTAPSTINSGNTQSQTPVTLPSTTASTTSLAGSAINGSMAGVTAPATPINGTGTKAPANGGDTSLDPLIQSQNTAISTDKSTVATAKSDLDALIEKLSGKGDAQVAAEAAAGIPALTTQNAALIGQYNQLKASYDAQYQNILNTPGMTREQANQQVTELQRVNNANLANLAIQQSVVSGNLTAAQNLVNHKIDLQYGDLKDLISYQQSYLKDNESTLSDDQKASLQLQITKNTRAYDTATTAAKTLETQKLDTLKAMSANGASTQAMSEVQAQTTPEGVIATAGKYGVSLADQLTKANIAKAYADAQKVSTVAPDMKGETLNLGKDTSVATTLETAGITSADLVGVQNYLQKGYSLNQIAKMTGMPASVYAALIPYINVPKEGSALGN